MSIIGFLYNFTLIDEQREPEIKKYFHVKIELFDRNGDLTVNITPEENVFYEIDLKNCTLIEESSNNDTIKYIHIHSHGQFALLFDREKRSQSVLCRIHNYLTKRTVDYLVNSFVDVINSGDSQKAKEWAQVLAYQKLPVNLNLDVTVPLEDKKQSESILPALKLKIFIETISVKQIYDQPFEIFIRPLTTVDQLKTIIEEQTGISKQQQFWFIDSNILQNNYTFGESQPLATNDTILRLYVATSTDENTFL